MVDGLTLEIRPGRIFWIVGPNGAGKSSLLRVIAGLDRPRAGLVRRAPADARAWRYFSSEMALPASVAPADWDRLIRRLMGAHGGRGTLWPRVSERRRVSRLSTGERKRLLLDALLRLDGPLLLDEPLEHLSPDGKRELLRLLEARARDHVVVVATNQATERARADGGIRLEGGQTEHFGVTGAAVSAGAPGAGAAPGVGGDAEVRP